MRAIYSLMLGLALGLGGAVAEAKKPEHDGPRQYENEPRSDERESRRRRHDSEYEQRPRYQPGYESPRRSLSDAVAEAERRTGGRALTAEPRADDGRVIYRVKILTPDGRVQILHLDAN